MKKILILGVTSIIGYRFYQQNKDKYNLYGLCRNWPLKASDNVLSIENLNSNTIENFIYKIKPDVVINCIGINDVGKCESNNELSKKLNVELVTSLVSVLNTLNIKLVSFSSSHIFSGNSNEYFENSNAEPVNTYGKQKKYVDNYINLHSKNFLLLRLTSILASRNEFQRNNLSNFIVDNLSKNQIVTLVCDDKTNFIYIDDVINIIALLLDKNSSGVFNVAGDEVFSRYELGLLIMKKMKLINMVKLIFSADYFTEVEYPKSLVLNNQKLKNEIDYSFKPMGIRINDLLKMKRL